MASDSCTNYNLKTRSARKTGNIKMRQLWAPIKSNAHFCYLLRQNLCKFCPKIQGKKAKNSVF